MADENANARESESMACQLCGKIGPVRTIWHTSPFRNDITVHICRDCYISSPVDPELNYEVAHD
jgi:hypothetical protein